MLLRKLVVVGLVGLINCAAQIATAQEADAPPPSFVALDGVSFADTHLASSFSDQISLDIGRAGDFRFTNLSVAPLRSRDFAAPDTSYEFELSAQGLAGFGVSAAQRGRFGFDAAGDVARESRSAEVRLGRGLSRENAPDAAWYVFIASEDEALVWRPGQRTAFGGASAGFALQDRVEIGDIQAGVTYEVHGVQASLAYVEREVSVTVGRDSFSTEERFAGVTITVRN